MNSGQLLHFSLVFHIIGLTIVGGSTLVAFVVQNQFWKQYEQDTGNATGLMVAAANAQDHNDRSIAVNTFRYVHDDNYAGSIWGAAMVQGQDDRSVDYHFQRSDLKEK